MAILFQLTMFTGKLSDVLCCVGRGRRKRRMPELSEYCRWQRSDVSAPSDTERLSVSNREGDDPVMLRRGLISDLLQTFTAVL